jgi:Protein of unknown function (DUF3631)
MPRANSNADQTAVKPRSAVTEAIRKHQQGRIDFAPLLGRLSRSLGEDNKAGAVDSRISRVAGFFRGPDLVDEVARFISSYIYLPDRLAMVAALWAIASWLHDSWDRFPHIAAHSPEKRCGKTTFLKTMEYPLQNPHNAANISPAVLYRVISNGRRDGVPVSILLDEAQSIVRRASESSEVIRELFNAAIDRNAVVMRCGGRNFTEVEKISIYCPKIIAFIGQLDGVLADRCLPIRLERKGEGDRVKHFRSREIEKEGTALKEKIGAWASDERDAVQALYDEIEPFDIENDRLAELLMPLQAVAQSIRPDYLPMLRAYADQVEADEEDKHSEQCQLLSDIRLLFDATGAEFLSTDNIIRGLCVIPESPWPSHHHGESITDKDVAGALKAFRIKPDRLQARDSAGGKFSCVRGYYREQFTMVWSVYLSPVSENCPTNGNGHPPSEKRGYPTNPTKNGGAR